MKRTALAISLLLVSSLGMASDLSVRLSYMSADLHGMEGAADSIQDQRDLEGGLGASRSDAWTTNESARYAVEIMKTRDLSKSISVGYGLILMPGYEVDAVSDDKQASAEIRVDGMGAQLEIQYSYQSLGASFGMSVTYWESKINTWLVTDGGMVEDSYTIKDSAVTPYVGLSYDITDNVSIRAAHHFDIGTKSYHGSGPMSLIGLDVRF